MPLEVPVYVFALSTASLGRGVRVERGEARYADDPLVLAHPDLFSATHPDVKVSPGWVRQEPPVEQASAFPGEKRSTRRQGGAAA